MARGWKHTVAAVAVFFLLALQLDVTIYSTTSITSISDLHPVRRLQDGRNDLGFVIVLLIWVSEFVGMIAFMIIYKQKVVDKIPTLPSKEGAAAEFDGGICDCASDCDLCMHTLCCLWCRRAHNWQVSGVMDYYMAILVQFAIQFINVCGVG